MNFKPNPTTYCYSVSNVPLLPEKKVMRLILFFFHFFSCLLDMTKPKPTEKAFFGSFLVGGLSYSYDFMGLKATEEPTRKTLYGVEMGLNLEMAR